MRGRRGDDVGHDGDRHRDRDVPVALARLVRVRCVEVGHDDGEDIGRRGEEERDDGVVSERVDDGGEEVGHCPAGDDAEEEDQLCRSAGQTAAPGVSIRGGGLTKIYVL